MAAPSAPAAAAPEPRVAVTEPVAATTPGPRAEAPVAPPPRESERPVVATPLAHAPKVVASFAAPPATYKVVSEHDKAAEEPHTPVRRRRENNVAAAPAEPLQIVETASDKVVAQPFVEDEAPRRPLRRRRGADDSHVPAEPLQLVETSPGARTADGDASRI